MSLPALNPDKSTAGIAVDPQTLERVIPESRRPDGTVRKQIKIRPGYTPQEDVSRFRSTRQQQMERTALPKGHIIGWVPPTAQSKQKAGGSSAGGGVDGDKPLTKSAAKNAKRKAKKQSEKEKVILANWEDDDDVVVPKKSVKREDEKDDGGKENVAGEEDEEFVKEDSREDQLAEELDKLEVK